jgi:hypothetical protein
MHSIVAGKNVRSKPVRIEHVLSLCKNVRQSSEKVAGRFFAILREPDSLWPGKGSNRQSDDFNSSAFQSKCLICRISFYCRVQILMVLTQHC